MPRHKVPVTPKTKKSRPESTVEANEPMEVLIALSAEVTEHRLIRWRIWYCTILQEARTRLSVPHILAQSDSNATLTRQKRTLKCLEYAIQKAVRGNALYAGFGKTISLQKCFVYILSLIHI